MAVCQNLVPLVNIKIAGKWMFIPLKMVLIGIDPYLYNLHHIPIYCSRYIKKQLHSDMVTGRAKRSREQQVQSRSNTSELASKYSGTCKKAVVRDITCNVHGNAVYVCMYIYIYVYLIYIYIYYVYIYMYTHNMSMVVYV